MPIPLPFGLGYIGTSEDVHNLALRQEVARKAGDEADVASVAQRLATLGDDPERIVNELGKTLRPPGEAAAKMIATAVQNAQQRIRARQFDPNSILQQAVTIPGTPGTPGTPAREDAEQGMTVMGTPGTPGTPARAVMAPASAPYMAIRGNVEEALNPLMAGLAANVTHAAESQAKLGVARASRWKQTDPDINGNVYLIDSETGAVKPASSVPGQLLQFIPKVTEAETRALAARGVRWAQKSVDDAAEEKLRERGTTGQQINRDPESGNLTVLPPNAPARGFGRGWAPAAAPGALAPPVGAAAPAPPVVAPAGPRAPVAPPPDVTPSLPEPAGIVPDVRDPWNPPPTDREITLAALKTPGGPAAFERLPIQEQMDRVQMARRQMQEPGRRDLGPPPGVGPRAQVAAAEPAVIQEPPAAPMAPAPATAPATPSLAAPSAPAAPVMPPGAVTITGTPRPMDPNRAATILAAPEKYPPERVKEAQNFTDGMQKRAIERVEAEAKARADVDLAKKLREEIGDDAIKWVDATSPNFDNPPGKMTRGQLNADPRYVQLELQQRTALKGLNTVREQFQDMKAKAGDVFRSGEDPKKAWLRILKETYFGSTQQQVRLQQLETYRTILGPQIQKVALGDVGNMAVQEQAVVKAALAQPFNSLESALAGLEVMEKFLEATPRRILEQGKRQMGRAGLDPDAVPSGILVPMPAATAAQAGGGGVVGAPVPRKKP